MGAMTSVEYKTVDFTLSSGGTTNHLGKLMVQRATVSRPSAEGSLKVVDGNNWRAVDLVGESLAFSGYIIDPDDVVGVLERGMLVGSSEDSYDITVGGKTYKNCSCVRAKAAAKIENGVNLLEGILKFHRTLRDDIPAYSSSRWLWKSVNGVSMEEVVSSSVVEGGKLLLADVHYARWHWSCERYQICKLSTGVVGDTLPDELVTEDGDLDGHVALPDGTIADLDIPGRWPSSSIDYDKMWYKKKTHLKFHNDHGIAVLSERWEARLPAEAFDVVFALDDEKPRDKANESEVECN